MQQRNNFPRIGGPIAVQYGENEGAFERGARLMPVPIRDAEDEDLLINELPNAIKVAVVGNKCTGKTKICRELQLINNREAPLPHLGYAPTIGVDVIPYRVRADKCFNIWDIAGDARFLGLAEGYLVGAQLALIVRGPLNRIPCANDRTIQEWQQFVRGMVGNIPMCVIDNTDNAVDFLARF